MLIQLNYAELNTIQKAHQNWILLAVILCFFFIKKKVEWKLLYVPSVFSSLDSNSIKLHRKFFWGDSLQKYNKASWLNNNKMANLLFCFLNHLWNYQAKFIETLQEAALHDPLQKYNKASRLTPTPTTKWLTSCFALKNMFSKIISTVMKLPMLILYMFD